MRHLPIPSRHFRINGFTDVTWYIAYPRPTSYSLTSYWNNIETYPYNNDPQLLLRPSEILSNAVLTTFHRLNVLPSALIHVDVAWLFDCFFSRHVFLASLKLQCSHNKIWHKIVAWRCNGYTVTPWPTSLIYAICSISAFILSHLPYEHYGQSLPSADSRRAVVSFWRKNVHNTGEPLRRLSLPSKTCG